MSKRKLSGSDPQDFPANRSLCNPVQKQGSPRAGMAKSDLSNIRDSHGSRGQKTFWIPVDKAEYQRFRESTRKDSGGLFQSHHGYTLPEGRSLLVNIKTQVPVLNPPDACTLNKRQFDYMFCVPFSAFTREQARQGAQQLARLMLLRKMQDSGKPAHIPERDEQDKREVRADNQRKERAGIRRDKQAHVKEQCKSALLQAAQARVPVSTLLPGKERTPSNQTLEQRQAQSGRDKLTALLNKREKDAIARRKQGLFS